MGREERFNKTRQMTQESKNVEKQKSKKFIYSSEETNRREDGKNQKRKWHFVIIISALLLVCAMLVCQLVLEINSLSDLQPL